MKKALIFLYSLLFTGNVFSQNTEEEKRFIKENNLSQQEYNSFINKKNLLTEAKPFASNSFTLSCSANMPANIGFEQGNFSGWDISSGFNYNLNPDTLGAGSSTVATIISSGTDPYTGISLTSPLGGTKIVKLNDNINNCSAQILRTSIHVTNATKFLKTAFAVVFQTAQHACNKNPYFKIEIFNCGETQKLNEYVTLIQEGHCAGDSLLATTNSTAGTLSYSQWRTHCFDFTNYLNSDITLKVSIADCPFIGHFGYAYFDAAFMPNISSGLNYNYTINNSNFNFSANNATSTCLNNAMNFNLPNGYTNYSSSSIGGFYLPGPFSSTTQAFSVPPIASGPMYILMNNTANNCYQQQLVNTGITPTVNIISSSSSVCPQANFTLNVSGANTYYFLSGPQNPSPTNSFVLNINSPTTYSIVGLNNKFCTNTATISVGVYPTNTITVIPMSQTICTGNTATLNASGANTYTWSNNLNGSAISVTPAVGTNSFTVMGKDMNGCDANFQSWAVINVVPTNTNFFVYSAGSASICPGDSAYILCSNTAQSVLWSNGSTLTAQFVKPTVTTVYTVTGTMSCNTVVQTITITVKPVVPTNITVNSPSLVCGNASFTVNSTGAPSYTYIGTNSVVTSGLGSITLPNTATDFTVIAKNPANCSITFSVIPITVNPAPIVIVTPSVSTVCAGQQATISATGANTYTWTNYFFSTLGTGSPVSFTTNMNISPVHYLYATGANGCPGFSSFTVNTEPSISISSNTNTLCLGPNYSASLSATYVNTATTTYTWNGSVFSHSIIDTPTTTTTYTLETYNAACGYMSATKTITVFPSYGPTVTAAASASLICGTQQTVSITATGANNYQYPYVFLTTNTVITVSPGGALPGNTFVVYGYDGYGCKSPSNVVNLTITPLPIVNNMPSQVVCPGTPVTLTVTGAQTYSWSTGATSTLITVSPTVSTLYTVVGFNNPGSCSVTSQKNITVYGVSNFSILPSASTSVCPGQSKNISINSSSAVTYSWSTGSTATSILVSPTVSTIYTVTISDFNNCKSSQTFTVGIHNLPNVSASFSPASSCYLTPASINPIGSPAGGYFTFYNIPNNVLAPVGIFTVQYNYVDPTTTCFNSAVAAYSILPNPCVSATPVNDTLCIGQTTGFNLSPLGGVLSGPSLSANNFTAVTLGSYPFSYFYTDANGCSVQACTSVFVDICTGVSERNSAENFEVSVAPNPFNGVFKIITSQTGIFNYYLYDVNGKIILSAQAESNVEVSLSNFPDGIYFLRFDQKAYSKGIKVVKTR